MNTYLEVIYLCEYGWSQNLPDLTKQLKSGLASHRPADDVVSTVRSLISAIAEANLGKSGTAKPTVIMITNGMEADE